MSSNKYIGYFSGAAVAAGVGAAIAVAGQGTAHADADSTKPASSESKSTGAAKSAKPAKKDSPSAGPKRPVANAADDVAATPTTPKFDPADAVDGLKKQFAGAKTTAVESVDVVVPESAATPSEAAPTTDTAIPDLATKASEAAAVLVKPLAAASSSESARTAARAAAADSSWYVPNTAPVPWDWNPFRAGDPIPVGMPEVIWQLELGTVGLFDPIPFFQPLVRETFEFGYRVSQIIPWVNVVLPLTNILGQIPNFTSGDPVLAKDAAQSIINNLLVTTQPVAILFYGYDQIADIFNLEYEAEGVKTWFYATTWDILDFFGIFHNKGESGLPLSQNPAGSSSTPAPAAPEEADVQSASYSKSDAASLAAVASSVAATTDEPGSDPLRADDPWPTDMPADILNTEKAIVGFLPAEIAPVVREAYEAIYRLSQVIPFVNVPIPVTEILQALTSGNGTAVQTTVNQLLLTTQPVSFLYYGFDELVDLLNIEDQGYAAKQAIYSTIWDLVDPSGAVHVLGSSGI